MKRGFLSRIVARKRAWIEAHRRTSSTDRTLRAARVDTRSFYRALDDVRRTRFILEYKNHSPSHGRIRRDSFVLDAVRQYTRYASVISVATDEEYFRGSFDVMTKIRRLVDIPVLCKDFIVDPWQVHSARMHGADAVLLILSILDDRTYSALSRLAHRLGMGVLTEISNETERRRAVDLRAKVVGINNRNLDDFSIDFTRTQRLSVGFPDDTVLISESGVRDYSTLRKLRRYVHGFLIGSVLMQSNDVGFTTKRVLFGENKVCGLTRVEDAVVAFHAGACYGGLIFVPSSPRCVRDEEIIRRIVSVPMRYVGVFRNDSLSRIVEAVGKFRLSAVQLHGHETSAYVRALRRKIPTACGIWKGIDMSETDAPCLDRACVDRYLLDNGRGGSGRPFEWTRIRRVSLDRVVLAGGLGTHNCADASAVGCAGLDFNSCLEDTPGIKNHRKIRSVFRALYGGGAKGSR